MTAALIRLGVLILLVATPGWALAEDSGGLSTSDRQAIHGTIQGQLDAFRGNDGPRAFSYASPTVREMFRTPENFIAMVRNRYAAVYRPREVEFLETYAKNRQIGQAVRFVGPYGKGFMGIYAMQRQSDGSWRIDGVVLIPIPDQAI